MKATQAPFNTTLTDFFNTYSKTIAHGANVVNVIIVDFRGTDTLGEIAVVAIAGLAILALIRVRAQHGAQACRKRSRCAGRSRGGAPMNTLIFRTIAPVLTALMLLFSVFVLLRGHNEPGGGFIGGLIAASALAIFGIARGVGSRAPRHRLSSHCRSPAPVC
jgi:multisubunit Na+/H+ antiporter MnhB subunit